MALRKYSYRPIEEQYRRMVAQAAWKAWRKLPMQTRIWIGIDDMIEDGMFWAYRRWSKDFDSSRASLSTYICHGLHNFYIDHYLKVYGAQMRDQFGDVSLQEIEARLKAKRSRATLDDVVHQIPDLVVSQDSVETAIDTECFVLPVMEQVYRNASPRLQQEIKYWFLQSNRVQFGSRVFKKRAREFRVLATAHGLEADDCLHMLRSPQCLNALTSRLYWADKDIEVREVIGNVSMR